MIQEMKGMITGRELVERLTDSIVVEEVEERGGGSTGERRRNDITEQTSIEILSLVNGVAALATDTMAVAITVTVTVAVVDEISDLIVTTSVNWMVRRCCDCGGGGVAVPWRLGVEDRGGRGVYLRLIGCCRLIWRRHGGGGDGGGGSEREQSKPGGLHDF